MSDSPARFIIRLMLETLPFWAPMVVLLFGVGIARNNAWRIAFLILAAVWCFVCFYGALMLGQDVNVQIFMAFIGTLVGLFAGLAFRRARA